MSRRLRNQYIPISRLRDNPSTRTNVIAMMAEVGAPRMSAGTDFYIILRLIDHSCQFRVSVNIFAPTVADLPHIRSVGDIICLHNVKAEVHNGHTYCSCKHRVSSYALFDREGNTNVIPYETSENFQATDNTSQSLHLLRTLSLESYQLNANHRLNAVVKLLLLKELEDGKVCDILCKVFHVCRIAGGDGLILYLWDGTDIPPITFKSNLNAKKDNSAPLHPEQLLLSRELLSSFPRIGTMFRVTAPCQFEHIFNLLGKPWVKFCNVTCQLRSEILIGNMDPRKSKVFIFSDENENVQHRERMYKKRTASSSGRVPLTCSLQTRQITVTDYDYETVSFATLMETIHHDKPIKRSKCMVRVVAAIPWHSQDLQSVVGVCRVRLTLEDPTARIHAYIAEQDWVKFFGPNVEVDALNRKMMKILGMQNLPTEGNEEVSRNPPWIKCILRKYYADKNDKLGTMRFQIYATRLVDDAQGEGAAQEATTGTEVIVGTADMPIMIDD